MYIIFLSFAIFVSSTYGGEAKIDIVDTKLPGAGEEDEVIWVDLKMVDPETNSGEEIQLKVNLQFQLMKGVVHVNGHPCNNEVVNAVHIQAQITEFSGDGVNAVTRDAPVVVRVMIREEESNGLHVLVVEEEVIAVDKKEVLQVDIKQLRIESMDKMNETNRIVTAIKVEDSILHQKPRHHDHHCGDVRPRLPEHPLASDEKLGGERHDHSQGRHLSFSCWFHDLSLRSRLCIFFALALLALTLMLCCSVCCKRRRRTVVEVLDDTNIDSAISDLTVDMEDVKFDDDVSKKPEPYNFHFEFDNAIVVDDKHKLLS